MRQRLRRLVGGEPSPPAQPALFDDSVPLPPGAQDRLRPDHPRLVELRGAYAAIDLPVQLSSRWSPQRVERFLDLRWFRGETLITWHYRESPRINELKYFVLLQHVAGRDAGDLLRRLGEDGLFGCWTFEYEGHPRVSRDLLESVNELRFLEQELGLAARERFSVLDIGAGYGRLAHRMAAAYDNLDDYCCVDVVPESTFLSEYYLAFRGAAPPARVVALHELDAGLAVGGFDVAVNIHSFSECPLTAVEWWIELLARLRVPEVVIVPNDGTDLLSLEPDGTRRDFAPTLARAGYRRTACTPVYDDPAVRALVQVDDHFHRFTLER